MGKEGGSGDTTPVVSVVLGHIMCCYCPCHSGLKERVPKNDKQNGKERSVERVRFAGQSFLKGRERAIVNQTNTGTVSKESLGNRLRDGVKRIFSERIDTILN